MRQRVRTVSKLILLIILFLILTGTSQDFQIRTRVDLVVVPVTVKGNSNRLISGLTKDDFIILEDGRRQTITNFTTDPVPISAAVLIDTGLTAKSFDKVQGSFIALAGAFSEFDEVSVYRFDNYVAKILDFTKEALVFEAAMKTLEEIEPVGPSVPSGPFSTPGPVINGAPVAPSAQIGVRIQSKGVKVLHDAIFTAALDLSKRESNRRRIVLVVSDGGTKGSEHSFDETLNRLLTADVQVYAIGMDQSFFTRKLSVLNSYSKETGGDACYLSSQHALESCYARAVEQARNQYVLGYVSNNKAPGRLPVFRRIEVKLAELNYDTTYRRGYFQYP